MAGKIQSDPGELSVKGGAGAPSTGMAQVRPEDMAAVLENLTHGVVVHRDFRPLYINPAQARLFGFQSAEEMTADAPLLERFELGHREKLEAWYRTHLGREEQEFRDILPATRKDRTRVWLNITSRFMEWEGQHAAVIVMYDAGPEQEAREKLRASEEKFRHMVEFSSDGLIVWNSDLQIIQINSRTTDLLGYSEEELLATTMEQLLLAEDIPGHPLCVEELQKNEMVTAERRFRKNNGDVLYVEVSSRGLPGGLFQSSLRDITERKEAQKAMEMLSTAVEQAGDIVFITDPGGEITYVNPAFERITGYTAKEAIGQTPRILKSGQKEINFYRNMWEQLLAGKSWKGHYRNRRKDGSFYEVDSIHSPVFNEEGQLTHIIAVHHDISDRIELEHQLRQSQKMEAMGQMAGGVAHEFNNLLQVIRGYSELAMRGVSPDAKQYRDLKQIQDSVEKATLLTGHLLAYTRQQPMQRRTVNINQLVEGFVNVFSTLVRDNITIKHALDPNLHTTRADPNMLEQVLMNICLNARDAMPDGGEMLIRTTLLQHKPPVLRAEEQLPEGLYLCLSITDTGVGMTKDVQQQIFDPFFTTKSPGKGTGLGLSMAYGIIEQHQGLIDLYSEPGAGTTFSIYLPAMEGARSSAEKTPVSTATILVAEDDPAVRDFLGNVFRDDDIRVLVAEDGQEAVQLFKAFQDDICMAILDVIMPKKSGTEVFNEIRKSKPGLPVIFCSGYNMELPSKMQPGEDNTWYFKKPYPYKELLDLVRAHIH